jgi:CubicO group peptidase (beta-lactamase class C family)
VNGLQALADGAAAKPPAGLVLTRRGAGGEIETVAAGPVDAGAVFELGSITKAVTGLLLADAAVRGEVALDEPLAACLPGARPRAPITLQELATHTAGLPRLPLGYLRRHAIRHRAGRMWWHNGGTGGSRAFTGFLAERGVAVAAVANAAKSPDRVAVRVLAGRYASS